MIAAQIKTFDPAPGWKKAYRAWAQAGWNGLAAPAQWGGQELPQAVNAACIEMWNSAAMAFGLGPLLTMAGVDALVLTSLRRFGARYALDLKVLDPARNRYLVTAKEEGPDQDAIPAMIDRSAERVRTDLHKAGLK